MLDYLLFRQLVLEIQSEITGIQIRKTRQFDPQGLVLSFGRGRGLVISLKAGVAHLRLDEIPAQRPASPFFLLAKKYLEDRKIFSFEEIPGQKIVILKAGEVELVIELPGIRNRCFLLNQEKKILATFPSFEKKPGESRIPQKNSPYVPPEPPGYHLFLCDENLLRKEWPDIFSGKVKIWWGLNKLHWKVLRQYSQEEALKIFLEARKPVLRKPVLIYEGEKVEGVSLLPALHSFKTLEYASLHEAIGRFFAERSKEVGLAENRKKHLSAIEQLLFKRGKKLEALSAEYAQAQHGEEWKECGDLLLTNVGQIEKGSQEFFDPLSGKKILLDPELDAVKNAQAYYRRFKKAKNAVTAIGNEIQKLKQEIETISELGTWAMLAEEESHWAWLSKEISRFQVGIGRVARGAGFAEPFLRFRSKQGYLFFVGRNAEENMKVLRAAQKEDWWFHAKGIPGGHVVIRVEEKPVCEKAIQEAASLAAYYSKGRNWDKVPVDYTLRKEVRSIPGGKAHVAYRNFKTVFVSPKSQ